MTGKILRWRTCLLLLAITALGAAEAEACLLRGGLFFRKRKQPDRDPAPSCASCPAEPESVQAIPPNWKEAGVDWSKIPAEPNKYLYKGKPASRAEVLAKVKDGTLKDDSGQPFLTVICGDEARRAKEIDDLLKDPEFGPILKQTRIQDYDPASKVSKALLPLLKLDEDEAFKTTGMVIVVQDCGDAQGRALTTKLYGDATGAEVVDGLKKVQPDWAPIKNLIAKKLDLEQYMWPVGLLTGGLGLLFILRHKE